jgi:hypothetical protein
MSNTPDGTDEKTGLEKDPEAVVQAPTHGSGATESRPDVISDPGVEGGVDAPNESEEPQSED